MKVESITMSPMLYSIQPRLKSVQTDLEECIQNTVITPYTPNKMVPYIQAIKHYCEIAETTLGFVEGANNG